MFSGARPPACEAWVGGAVGHRPDADCDVQGLGGAGHRSEPPYVESSERRGDGRLGGSGDYNPTVQTGEACGAQDVSSGRDGQTASGRDAFAPAKYEMPRACFLRIRHFHASYDDPADTDGASNPAWLPCATLVAWFRSGTRSCVTPQMAVRCPYCPSIWETFSLFVFMTLTFLRRAGQRCTHRCIPTVTLGYALWLEYQRGGAKLSQNPVRRLANPWPGCCWILLCNH